jgi:imidazole glycerol-phosphate synthase subunit HisH
VVVVIDYGLGNLRSILYKLKKFKIDCIVSADPHDIESADKLILPGVGAFGEGIRNIEERGLREVLNSKVLGDKTPVLGICLGMQLMTNFSEEADVAGLGWIDAKTTRFSFADDAWHRVPHMGWNTINLKQNHLRLSGLKDQDAFYFVHSYYVKCVNEENVIATTNYGLEFDSVIADGNVVGMQFHPERSHKHGVKLMIDFCESD